MTRRRAHILACDLLARGIAPAFVHRFLVRAYGLSDSECTTIINAALWAA